MRISMEKKTLDIIHKNKYNHTDRGGAVKRRDLINKLKENGFVLDRHGSNHDIYFNEKTKKRIPVGRHR